MIWYHMQPSTENVTDLPFYLISIGLHELQPKIDRPDGKEHDQFFFNTCGTGWLELNNNKYHLHEGSAFFIPAGMPHCYYPDGNVWDVRWMELDGFALKHIHDKYDMNNGMVFELTDETELDRLLNQMRKYVILDSEFGTMLAASYIYPFIMEFIYQSRIACEREKEISKADKQMKLLEEYIKVHYMHHVSLDELAKVIHVSPQYICKLFRKNYDMRPMEYLNMVRIEEAKNLLIYSDYKVCDIASKCGFKNANYFCKYFLQQERLTPSEYRNSIL